MNLNSPSKIAFFISACFSLLFSILAIYPLITLNNSNILLWFIFSLILMFVLNFIVTRYIVNIEVFRKIRLIYKTIRDEKLSSKEKKNLSNSYNIGMIEDVQKEVEQWAANQSEEMTKLKVMEEYRREFVGNVSHELKTPVFNIQGYVLTLLDGGLEDESINKLYLEKSERSIDRIIDIIDDLEEISKLETKKNVLEIVPFDFVNLCNEVIELLEVKAKNLDVEVKFNVKEDKKVMVVGDVHQYKKVLTNLIDNAIKYRSTERDDSMVTIKMHDMDEHILIEITDNGIGIDKENLPRLFERFYRTDKGRSREEGGTGLGLSIVKHVIEAHNQTINVRSAKGVGSTFAFTLQKTI